jgi:hypothetical protein
MYDELAKLLASLPPDPIAPENRRFARLQLSAWIPSGTVFRIAPGDQHEEQSFKSLFFRDIGIDGLELAARLKSMGSDAQRPTIVLHPDDVKELVAHFGERSGWSAALNVEQEIADVFEEIFARREVRGL